MPGSAELPRVEERRGDGVIRGDVCLVDGRATCIRVDRQSGAESGLYPQGPAEGSEKHCLGWKRIRVKPLTPGEDETE